MIAHDVLQTLGETKRARVLKELVDGVCARSIARTIQTDWGDLQHLGRDMLVKQIMGWRMAMMNKVSVERLSEQELNKPTPDGCDVDPLASLEQLAPILRSRTQWLANKRQRQNKPMPELGEAIRINGTLLVAIHTMRLERGLDESNIVVLTQREQEARGQLHPLQRQILEAVTFAEEVITKRGITLSKEVVSEREDTTRPGSDGNLPRRARVDDSKVRPLDEVAALAQTMKAEVLRLYSKERQQNRYIHELSEAIKVYGKLLIDLQTMRFNLGLDGYKSKRERNAAAAEARQRQEDENNRQIFEAYKEAEEIFAGRRKHLRQIGSEAT